VVSYRNLVHTLIKDCRSLHRVRKAANTFNKFNQSVSHLLIGICVIFFNTNGLPRDNNISIDSFFTDIHVYLMDAPLLDVINALGLKHNLDSFRVIS
jgi:hypothetical protein